jgi:transcriptional regulator with XRE-family HTH domain
MKQQTSSEQQKTSGGKSLVVEGELEIFKEEIAGRFRTIREKLPAELAKAGDLARELKKSAAYISRLETGAKSVPAEVLVWMAKRAKVAPWELFFGEARRPAPPFQEAAAFLQRANEMGIVNLEPDRERALSKIVPFIDALDSGTVDITGSTLRGLRQKSPDPFVIAVRRKREPVRLAVRILFTHLEQAFLREELEGRNPGAIVQEVVEGIRWARDTWHLDWQDIKLVKAPPALFSVFVGDREQARGVGVANIYPLMTQAYVSPAMVLQNTGNPSEIYQALHRTNFADPWEKASVTVKGAIEDWDKTTKRAADKQKIEALQRAVQMLKEELKGQSQETSHNSIGASAAKSRPAAV